MRTWVGGFHAVAVGGWLGAAALAGFVVAPAAFETLPSRAAAGSFVGGILGPVNLWCVLAGAVACAAVAMRGSRFTKGRWAAAVLLLAAGIASVVLRAKIGAMREALGPIDALAADDPGRRAFGALHGVSMIVMLVGLLAAAASLFLEAAAQPTSRSSASG